MSEFSRRSMSADGCEGGGTLVCRFSILGREERGRVSCGDGKGIGMRQDRRGRTYCIDRMFRGGGGR